MPSTRNRDLPPLEPLSVRLRTFAVLWGWVCGALLTLYPLAGYLASLRHQRYILYGEAELAIPLMPQWFFVYVSVYVMNGLVPFFLDCATLRQLAKALIAGIVLAGLCFVLFPASVGFAPALPGDEPWRTLFGIMFQVDSRFNTAPSLHVSCASSLTLALCARASVALRVLWCAWLVAVMCSTVLVHQHHIADVVTGFALGACLYWYYGRTTIGGAGRTPLNNDR